jgi:hypothetical protein
VAILGAEVNVRQGWASVSAFAVVRRLSRRLNARILKPSMADWLAYLTCVRRTTWSEVMVMSRGGDCALRS